jgi:hypothetical protein
VLQVFFYKRAQIFVGDVYGAFGGKGLGCFSDVAQLTMFADYRVPVVLRLMGLLRYSTELEQLVGLTTHMLLLQYSTALRLLVIQTTQVLFGCASCLFADYRVPVVLRLMGLLQCSSALEQQVTQDTVVSCHAL